MGSNDLYIYIFILFIFILLFVFQFFVTGAVYLDCKGDMEEIQKIVLYVNMLPQLNQPQEIIHSCRDDDD